MTNHPSLTAASADDCPRLVAVWLHDDDPCVGTVKVEMPGRGVLTQTHRWGTPERAQRMLPVAAERALTTPAVREAGESRRIKRVVSPLGEVFLGWLGGPPTWRLPRAGARRNRGYVEVMVGWWRRALVVGWRYR